MTKSLEEVKRKLSRKYLGKAGIHGMGVSHSKNAVHVYVEKEDPDGERQKLMEEIEKEAAPYKVLPVESERATAT